MKTTELMYKVGQRYIKLRAAIIEAYNHPDDDYYDMLETYAYDMLEEAIEEYVLARAEEKRISKERDELPF
ncbi:MAG: hypothetical protein IJS30_06050 [Bacteroidales bacterium]|nr:hypothetical protein [Bacteroidales bacterium]